MIRTISSAILLVACRLALGQAPQPTILRIDLDNFVQYLADTSDVSQYGTKSGVTPPGSVLQSADFWVATGLGDIVAINGQPAKGLYVVRARDIATDPNPRPGKAIGDVTREAFREEFFEILSVSGNAVGSIVALGLSNGLPPPGAPRRKPG